MPRRHWLSLLLTRGKPRPTPIDPQTLILESPDEDGGVRILSLENAFNFRDLGGYRTADGRRLKWGRVFRSGTLTALSDNDLRTLQALGLKQILDLRTPQEIATAPDRVPEGAEYVPMTVRSETSAARQLFSLMRHYNRMEGLLLEMYTSVILERNAPLFGEVFRRLAAAEGMPAVIHCTAGKDRTGVTAALLLAGLGVPENTIIADYALTNHSYEPISAVVREQMKGLERLGLTADDMQPLLLANPETMRAVFHYLHQRYGDVETYLRQRAGVDETTLTQLQVLLLE